MHSVLEFGSPGSAGVGKGVLPVLRGGAVVATMRTSSWKEAATAQVGDRSWVFARQKGTLNGRRADDPQHTVRLRAYQVSWWKATWSVDLEGTTVDVETLSWWKSTHRFVSGGRSVGESAVTGNWSGRPTLSIDDSLRLDHQVFLLWLELVITRRNQAGMIAVTGRSS